MSVTLASAARCPDKSSAADAETNAFTDAATCTRSGADSKAHAHSSSGTCSRTGNASNPASITGINEACTRSHDLVEYEHQHAEEDDR